MLVLSPTCHLPIQSDSIVRQNIFKLHSWCFGSLKLLTSFFEISLFGQIGSILITLVLEPAMGHRLTRNRRVLCKNEKIQGEIFVHEIECDLLQSINATRAAHQVIPNSQCHPVPCRFCQRYRPVRNRQDEKLLRRE